MKLSEYAKIAKREGCCTLLNVGGSGPWLATRSSVYCAGELPQIEYGDEMRTVLDLPEKDWKKIQWKTLECGSLDNVLGMNLREYDELEAYAKKMSMQAVYKGHTATALLCSDGELVFYNESLLAPVAKQLKESDYAQTVVRKYANGRRYVVVKDGIEVLAAVMPLDIITKEYLEELADFEVKCTGQFHREQARATIAAEASVYADSEMMEQMGIDEEDKE